MALMETTLFNKAAIELIMTENIPNCHGLCIDQDRKALQQVNQPTQNIMNTHPQGLSDIDEVRCLHRAHTILNDDTFPSHSLFILLPSDKRLNICCHTTRLWNSIFPHAVSITT